MSGAYPACPAFHYATVKESALGLVGEEGSYEEE
jgi:hypothetical protein